MIQRINMPVLVTSTFDPKQNKTFIETIVWDGRTYPVKRLGLHHTYRDGRTLHHVFSVETPSLSFRLVLNTDTLHWRVEEISDGEAD